MASENETIADIVADFREMVHHTVDGIIAVKADVIADRIEAAWKRERVEIATYAATQGVKLTNEKYANTPVGNAAAFDEFKEKMGIETVGMAKESEEAPPRAATSATRSERDGTDRNP